ncbi:MAG TPA: phosphoribosylanthranilate isomerase [Burkholderiaceae bacterium]|nr:phosphoribosylanthranilate isomerase [Burkholderiaceae bacterium]
MRTRVKFCGLTHGDDVDAAVALGVDAVGFVFYGPSPRCVQPHEAAELRRRLPSFVAAVGLFVNEDPRRVAETVRQAGLDVVQFHGDERDDACARAGVPYWKAVRMRARSDLLESAGSFPGAECLLLDAYSEGYGGSGRQFDWRWIPRELPARLILSGGLDADSVAGAIATVRPFGVDVSTGIQGATPRRKDLDRMQRFMAAVLSADAGRR